MLPNSNPRRETKRTTDTEQLTASAQQAASGERTACLSALLPKRTLACADLVVAHRRLANDWISRTEVIEECLDRFFEHGGMSATSTRPDPDPSRRHRYRMYLRFETVRSIYTDIVDPRNADELFSAWHIVATAMLDHLAECDPGLPPGPMYC